MDSGEAVVVLRRSAVVLRRLVVVLRGGDWG